MKKLTALLCLGLTAVIVSCSKDNTTSTTTPPVVKVCTMTSAISAGESMYYTYDANNRITRLTDSTSKTKIDTTLYTYTSGGQAAKTTMTHSGSQGEYYVYTWGTNQVTVNHYNLDGTNKANHKAIVQFVAGSTKVLKTTYYDFDGTTFNLTAYSQYTTDAAGNITKVDQFDNNGAPAGSIKVTYDVNPNPQKNIPSTYEDLDVITHCAYNPTKVTIDDGAGNTIDILSAYTYDSDKKPITVTSNTVTTVLNYKCK